MRHGSRRRGARSSLARSDPSIGLTRRTAGARSRRRSARAAGMSCGRRRRRRSSRSAVGGPVRGRGRGRRARPSGAGDEGAAPSIPGSRDRRRRRRVRSQQRGGRPRRRSPALPTTTQLPTDAEEAGEALANAIVGIDDEDAQGAGAAAGSVHARGRRATGGSTGRDDRPWRASAERGRGLRHAVADRAAGSVGDRAVAPRPARSRPRHDDLDRRPLPRPAPPCTSRRSCPPGRASRPARDGRPARAPASKPLPSSRIRSTTSARADRPPARPGARRVLDDVVERLLGDPVEDLLDLERQPLVSSLVDDDRQPDPALERGGVGPQRRQQPVVLEVARAGARRSAPASRPGPRAGGRGARSSFSLAAAGSRSISSSTDARDEGHREQRLGHRVVELAGEVGALLRSTPARRPGGAGRARAARAR